MFTWKHPKKWLILGLIIAFLQPLPGGLLVGVGLWSEEDSVKKGQGKIITIASVLWVVVSLVLATYLNQNGLLK